MCMKVPWVSQRRLCMAFRWAKKGLSSMPDHQGSQPRMTAQESPAWDAQHTSPQTWESRHDLSTSTQQSLQIVDEAVINYDLIEALIASIVQAEQRDGPGVFWQARISSLACQGLLIWHTLPNIRNACNATSDAHWMHSAGAESWPRSVGT